MFCIYILNFQIISSMINVLINIRVIVIWFFINQIRMSIKNRDWDHQRMKAFERVEVGDFECSGEMCGSGKIQMIRYLVSNHTLDEN